jgi:hypothetical protein
LDLIAKDYQERSDINNLSFAAFDAYEIQEITLSRVYLLTSILYDKILVRYGRREDFKQRPGSGFLMMALETCNASVSHDIDSAM